MNGSEANEILFKPIFNVYCARGISRMKEYIRKTWRLVDKITLILILLNEHRDNMRFLYTKLRHEQRKQFDLCC